MAKFELQIPITIGKTLVSPGKQLANLELVGFSMNVQPGHTDSGNGVLSVLLLDKVAQHEENLQYKDASVLEFLDSPLPKGSTTLREAIENLIFAKLVADGRLPTGELKDAEGAAVDLTAATTALQVAKPVSVAPAKGVVDANPAISS